MADAPLTIPEWWLVIVLATHAHNGLPPVQRFEDRARCEAQLVVQTKVHHIHGRQVVSAHCQRLRHRERAAR